MIRFRKETLQTPKFKILKRRCLLLTELILYLIGIGLLVQVFFVRDTLTSAFDKAAAERLIISESQQQQNTEQYQNWESNTCTDVCSVQLFHYYLFNITNPSEVVNGAYPQLQELGPFVFNRYEHRTNVSFSPNGDIVNYKYEYRYVLNEELSNMALWNRSSWRESQISTTTPSPIPSPNTSNLTLNDDDIAPYPPIYVINPFMLAAFASCRMSNDGRGGGAICNAIGFSNVNNFYFSNYSAQSILQKGMSSRTTIACNSNPLCNRTQKYIADDDVYVSEYTGTGKGNGNRRRMRELIHFYGRNQTYGGGLSQSDGSFNGWWEEEERFENTREPKQWPYSTINPQSVLKAWSMDKYRAVDLIADGTMQVQDVELIRFKVDPKEFLSAANNSKNAKYYQNGGLRDGILNLTTTNGANILQYSSKPYFLDAPYYIQEINDKMGLRKPNRSLDDTYFAVDGKLGTAFQVHLAYQVSFAIYPCSSCGLVNNFRNLPQLIVPTFYVVLKAGAPPQAIDQYRDILALLDTTSQYSVYAGPATALCCFVLALYLTLRRYCKWRRKHFDTIYDDGKEYYSFEEDTFDAVGEGHDDRECELDIMDCKVNLEKKEDEALPPVLHPSLRGDPSSKKRVTSKSNLLKGGWVGISKYS